MPIRTVHLHLDPQCFISNIALKCNDQLSKTMLELDSHANTSILGWHALIILDYNRPVPIVGYDESLGTHVYQTISGVMAYTDPKTRRTLHLVVNQAIHIPYLDHHLICPMQCCMNGVTVDEDTQIFGGATY